MPEVKEYLYYKIFKVADAEDVGGQTGSKKVKVGDHYYQLKRSVLDAKFSRKVKAGYTDQENFGEFIASAICRELTKSDSDFEFVPKVSLVYDKEGKSVLIASRYLQNVVNGDLREYAKKQCNVASKKKLKIALGLAYSNKSDELFLDGEENKQLEMDICRAIALSSIIGDHDVNPGNLVVVRDGSDIRVARIDLGHAFNDLLRFPSVVGGSVRNKSNKILDFFNREAVSHINPSHQKSKLWQNYKGMIPSLEMAKVLEEVSKASGLKKGLDSAKASFASLLDELLQDPKVNAKLINHIKSSLILINDNISSSKVSFNLHPQNLVDLVFSNIEKFCAENQRKMMDVSMLMKMQAGLDKMIDDKSHGLPVEERRIKEIEFQYLTLQLKDGIACSNGIRWLKIDEKTPAFEGDIKGYINQRSKVFGCDSSLSESFFLKSEQKKPITVNPLIKLTRQSVVERLLGFFKEITSKIKEFFSLSIKEKKLHSIPVPVVTQVPKATAALTPAKAARVLAKRPTRRVVPDKAAGRTVRPNRTRLLVRGARPPARGRSGGSA
jgi:hypothetical protein